MRTFLFGSRFNRVEFYGFLLAMWSAFAFENAHIMLAAIPVALISHFAQPNTITGG